MRGNHDLFDLIKSLSRSEKRHFRLYSSLQEGDKHYLTLFDKMQDLEVYREKELKKELADHPVVKHWAFNKKYLYDKIIESLGLIKLKEDSDLQVNELVKTYKILRSRGLNSQAMRYLSMAKKKAKANELNARLYDILNLEYYDRAFSYKKVVDPKFDAIKNERKTALNLVWNYSWVCDIYMDLEKWIQQNGVATSEKDFEELNQIIAPVLNFKRDQFISNQCWLLYVIAMTKYHQACGKPKNGFLMFNELSTENRSSGIWQSTAIGSLLLNAVKSYTPANIDELLNWLLQASEKPPFPYNHRAYEQWLYINLCYLCSKGEFKNATGFLDQELVLRFKGGEQLMSKWGRLNNYYMIAYAYFGSSEFDKAGKWCLKVLDSNETSIPVFTHARILQLLVLFEKGDFELFEYRLRSYDRSLKVRSPHCSLLKLGKLFNALRSIKKNEGALNTIAHSLIIELEQPLHSDTLFHVDLVSWIRSKISQITFTAAVKEKYEMLTSKTEKNIFPLYNSYSEKVVDAKVA